MEKNFSINALGYIDFNGSTFDMHSYYKLVSLSYDSLASKGKVVLAGREGVDPLVTIHLESVNLFKAVFETAPNRRSIRLDLIAYTSEGQEDCFMLDSMLNDDPKYGLTFILENESIIFVKCKSALINMDRL